MHTYIGYMQAYIDLHACIQRHMYTHIHAVSSFVKMELFESVSLRQPYVCLTTLLGGCLMIIDALYESKDT